MKIEDVTFAGPAMTTSPQQMLRSLLRASRRGNKIEVNLIENWDDYWKLGSKLKDPETAKILYFYTNKDVENDDDEKDSCKFLVSF